MGIVFFLLSIKFSEKYENNILFRHAVLYTLQCIYFAFVRYLFFWKILQPTNTRAENWTIKNYRHRASETCVWNDVGQSPLTHVHSAYKCSHMYIYKWSFVPDIGSWTAKINIRITKQSRIYVSLFASKTVVIYPYIATAWIDQFNCN